MDKGSLSQETDKSSRKYADLNRLKKSVDNWNKMRKILSLQKVLTCAHAIAYDKKKSDQFGDIYENETLVDKFKITFASSIIMSLLDMVSSLISGYLAFAIPFRLAFFSSHQISMLYIHDLILDSILFVHFLIKIISPTSRNSLLHELSVYHRFTYNFMRIRFYTDFLSIIPLYMISNKYYWFKLGRILRVVSIFSWMEESIVAKKLKNKSFFLRFYETYQTVIYSLKLTVLLMITCHCIACLWFYIPHGLSEKNENTWLGSNWEFYSTEDNYMRSLYWTSVTFSSVGYGDITGKTTEEYFYSMFVEFLGIICFAYLMGSLTNSISQYYAKRDAAKLRENELNNWMIFLEENIKDKAKQEEIEKTVYKYFEQKWTSNPRSLNNFEDFIMMMPQYLVEELSISLYGHRLGLFPFFDIFSDNLKLKISTLMFSEIYPRKIEIIKEGNKNNKIYFIVNGTVVAGAKALGYATVLGEKSYFGEDSAIFGDNSKLSFVSCQRVCLLYIEWPSFFKVLKNHGVDIMSHAKIAFKRAKYFFEATLYKYGSEYYISDDEMLIFAAKYKLNIPYIEDEDIEEFNERAEGLIMKLLGKKNQLFDLPREVVEVVQKESEKVEKDAKIVYDGYKNGLEDLIKKVKILKKQSGN